MKFVDVPDSKRIEREPDNRTVILTDGNIQQKYSDKQFLILMKKAAELGASIIGGCCGSSFHHISLIKKQLIEN